MTHFIAYVVLAVSALAQPAETSRTLITTTHYPLREYYAWEGKSLPKGLTTNVSFYKQTEGNKLVVVVTGNKELIEEFANEFESAMRVPRQVMITVEFRNGDRVINKPVLRTLERHPASITQSIKDCELNAFLTPYWDGDVVKANVAFGTVELSKQTFTVVTGKEKRSLRLTDSATMASFSGVQDGAVISFKKDGNTVQAVLTQESGTQVISMADADWNKLQNKKIVLKIDKVLDGESLSGP